MKRIYIFALIYLMFSPLTMSAGLKKILGRIVVIDRSGGSQSLSVTNGSVFSCKIVAYGKEIARLNPGDSIYDNAEKERISKQVPVAAICYEDAEMQEYAGAGGMIFNLISNFPYYPDYQSNDASWTIRNGNVSAPGGRAIDYPPIVLNNPSSKKVEFPRGWNNAVNGVQIVNNSYASVILRVNGENVATLKGNGDYRFLPWKASYYVSKNINIQAVFMENEKVLGTAEYYFYLPMEPAINGEHFVVQQVFLNNYDIRH